MRGHSEDTWLHLFLGYSTYSCKGAVQSQALQEGRASRCAHALADEAAERVVRVESRFLIGKHLRLESRQIAMVRIQCYAGLYVPEGRDSSSEEVDRFRQWEVIYGHSGQVERRLGWEGSSQARYAEVETEGVHWTCSMRRLCSVGEQTIVYRSFDEHNTHKTHYYDIERLGVYGGLVTSDLDLLVMGSDLCRGDLHSERGKIRWLEGDNVVVGTVCTISGWGGVVNGLTVMGQGQLSQHSLMSLSHDVIGDLETRSVEFGNRVMEAVVVDNHVGVWERRSWERVSWVARLSDTLVIVEESLSLQRNNIVARKIRGVADVVTSSNFENGSVEYTEHIDSRGWGDTDHRFLTLYLSGVTVTKSAAVRTGDKHCVARGAYRVIDVRGGLVGSSVVSDGIQSEGEGYLRTRSLRKDYTEISETEGLLRYCHEYSDYSGGSAELGPTLLTRTTGSSVGDYHTCLGEYERDQQWVEDAVCASKGTCRDCEAKQLDTHGDWGLLRTQEWSHSRCIDSHWLGLRVEGEKHRVIYPGRVASNAITHVAHLLPYCLSLVSRPWTFFEKQNISGSNFMDWYRNLWIVLSVEDKLPYLEQPIPAMPVLPPRQVLPPDVLNTHTDWVKASKEIAGLMLMTMEQLGRAVTSSDRERISRVQTGRRTVSKLHEQTLPPKDTAPALHAIRVGRVQKNQKKKSHKADKGNQGKGKANMGYAPVPSSPLHPNPRILQHPIRIILRRTQSATNVVKEVETEPGALSSVTGTMVIVQQLKLLENSLCLLSGTSFNFTQLSYAPFLLETLFHAIIKDGIYEIKLSFSNKNDSSMYAISNKRAKLNLDSTLLWHCHLGHISKKDIEKLQHDGLLDSTDIKSFEKCVSCMSGKMARKPYSHIKS
ncbi:retrotransposon protein, putative, ty1-copia subclass [Tanacetum coccineum]